MMESNLKKPKRLVPGDTIGIIAPSAGNAHLFPHRIDNAIKCLENLGYKTKFAQHSLKNKDYISANTEERVSDIHEMFKDKTVSAIICTIGGDHSNQLLKLLDFDILRKNPKIFMGYSDISVLHYAFMKKANIQTFYGPCIMTQFGEYPDILDYTLEYFNKAVTSIQPIGEINSSKNWTSEILDWTTKKDLERPRKLEPSQGYQWLKKGKASGKIIGGCVPSINHLSGTEYWIDPLNCIFLVDIPEGHEFGKGLAISDLDSYFADLDNLGVFHKIKGLIVGRPYNYSEEEYTKLKEIILYYTEKYNYPILLDANIGHSDPMITIPLGVKVSLDSEKNFFSIDESGVQ